MWMMSSNRRHLSSNTGTCLSHDTTKPRRLRLTVRSRTRPRVMYLCNGGDGRSNRAPGVDGARAIGVQPMFGLLT